MERISPYITEIKGGNDMKETERIKAGLLFRPNSMELRDTKHKAHETCRLVNTLRPTICTLRSYHYRSKRK